MKTTTTVLLALALGLPPVLAACSSEESQAVHKFGYTGDIGPEHWGDLNSDWILAKTGQQQSPIDLVGAADADVPDLAISYQEAPLEIVNNGHAIQVNYPSGSHASLGGSEYELQQFHFHTPSEHRIDGRHAAMELHLVHKNAAGELAVVAVMIQAGAEHPLLSKLVSQIPAEAGPAMAKDDVRINASEFLPADLTSFRYAGSLTTPPCSEGVGWIVLRSPIEASQAQVDGFKAAISGNNRPLQELHGREILVGK